MRAGRDPRKFRKIGLHSLSEAVFSKQLIVESGKEDRYRRKVGLVQHDGTDVNLEQINEGGTIPSNPEKMGLTGK